MKMTGITSFYRNGNERHKNFIIFILCGLDEEQAVVEGEWPGVMIEPGYKWPFIINVGFSSTMRFANQEIRNTTFGLRKILPGESFSVDPDWIYEVQTCRQYLDSDGTSSEQHVVKLAKITAACTNKNTSHVFVLWCGVNSMGEVQSGKWMGYCVDDGVTTPIVVAIGSGSHSEVDYGENNREPITIISSRVGDCFTIMSVNYSQEPDSYEYSITDCLLY